MFSGIGALPEPATESHVVNRGAPVAPCRRKAQMWQGGSWSHSDFTHKTGLQKPDTRVWTCRAGCACEAWAGARRESTRDVCVRGWNPEMLVVDDRPDFFAEQGAPVFAPAFALWTSAHTREPHQPEGTASFAL